MWHPSRTLPLLPALAVLAVTFQPACAHDNRVPASAAATPATASAGDDFSAARSWGCRDRRLVNAGFENGLDNGRWQVKWRKKAFIELWADPSNELWAVPVQSACTANADNPDRVIFTGVNWEQTAEPWWAEQLEKVLANIRQRTPASAINLMTMLRAPGNESCGNVISVVQPFVDQSIAGVVAKHPGLVFAAPKVFAPSCEVFTKGGPHYADSGVATVGQMPARQLPLDSAGCACRAKK